MSKEFVKHTHTHLHTLFPLSLIPLFLSHTHTPSPRQAHPVLILHLHHYCRVQVGYQFPPKAEKRMQAQKNAISSLMKKLKLRNNFIFRKSSVKVVLYSYLERF
jgi:hypothetical protein